MSIDQRLAIKELEKQLQERQREIEQLQSEKDETERKFEGLKQTMEDYEAMQPNMANEIDLTELNSARYKIRQLQEELDSQSKYSSNMIQVSTISRYYL